MDDLNMAAFRPRSLSPKVPDRMSLRMHAGNPMTPVHSPHHSVTSSASSRTPVHFLTIHEYRKQQHTPTLLRKGTPPGKTLRRKPAASTLSNIERVPSVAPPERSESAPSLRPLHFSQSAYQLKSNEPHFEQLPLLDWPLRSQSAVPFAKTGSVSSISTTNSVSKVRYFNSRKRLPKPLVNRDPASLPPPLANLHSAQPRRSSPPAALSFSSAERTNSREAQTTSTPSTFSVSRFPQPPRQVNPPLSPSHNEGEPTRINPQNYPTTAPATPPATPATIHYRGASFDVVNPHDSLLLHDIVTPSRDFDSSDYLPLRTSEDAYSEMAPKRAVYGDFRAAHAGILRRPEDSPRQSNADLPLPPTPAAVSANSSSYTSPLYSPESDNALPPLPARSSARLSRFSLKELTRSLTKRLGKTPVKIQCEELRDMRDQNISRASISKNGEYPRPLDQTYVTTPETSYFPVGPMSPMTPVSPASLQSFHAFSPEQNGMEIAQMDEEDEVEVEPLSSMIPDEPSTQIGRIDDSQLPYSVEGGFAKPYYDDLDSIYPSSSIYTGDNRHRSHYQQDSASTRNSHGNQLARYSNANTNNFVNGNNHDSLYDYSSSNRVDRQMLHMFAQEAYQRSVEEGDPKADTISKLIDEYNPNETTDTTLPTPHEENTDVGGHNESGSHPFVNRAAVAHVHQTMVEPDVRRFVTPHYDNIISPVERVVSRRPTFTQHPGLPPHRAAPLAPPFEYDDALFIPSYPGQSGLLSQSSGYSYGNTRELLQISPSNTPVKLVATHILEPSSSYSQPEVKPLEPSSSYSQAESAQSPSTPKEALDQAEQIFQDTVDKHQSSSKIPAMWARRNSASLLLIKTLTNRSSGAPQDVENPFTGEGGATAEEKADWETVGGDSPGSKARESMDSIADYSSSEGTRNSLGLTSERSLPSWANQAVSPARSDYYNHLSPKRTEQHHHFSSSPPELRPRAIIRTAPNVSSSPMAISAPVSRTTPVLHLSTHPEDVLGRGAVEQPYAFAPWADRYAFSDKETQELLASGPNDNIIVDQQSVAPKHQARRDQRSQSDDTVATSSTADESSFESSPVGLERENTFEKFSIVGPKGNLTGTPRGTGMHEAGSSIADTSSPGVKLSSSVGRQSTRSDYNGFYASPFPATGSVTRISQTLPQSTPEHIRISSETSFSPTPKGLSTTQEKSPNPGSRQHMRSSTTFLRSQRRTSRSAVPGQTKLRHMFLAPDIRSTTSTHGAHITRVMSGSDRPSTSDTSTPLRPSHPSLDIHSPPARSLLVQEHSPHLLCIERDTNPADEARRRKLSWIILGAFCLLPPTILLFRFLGDNIIASVTGGRLGHVTPQSKRTALIAGIAVNVGLVTVLLVPILVAHAMKAV
ncbi:hypothetical protein Alg130_07460 [Pyrenophora tritici-repentis]|uniref:Mating-C multi-domain protein n=3 Tax=Pyrenophora tritici-repentis TaxID=45151 RepID=A0A2W1HDX7_9PLEO|nr:hypothetical protein A1F99_084460 [Pyrenophora tritici-repentis]KAF7569287.1 Mating-C multi-domain protein [Pyrenophora tritici-repentis]KAI0572566.1 hypothetical protein Alg215_09701 [Pyrenophora tritici-repentis]KAI0579534.1 hypothetical protein Alg130_07460 [Pyrenophora tritici-repentis]KAI1544225.1 hypothetical protein PtrSN001A_002759 [Pyrenophora tritici-repentis]